MFVYTMGRKRAFRMAMLILAVFVGIAIGIAAILTAISSGAATSRVPIYSVDRGDNKISITFDCAWGNSNTDELIEILAKENVRATFFVTGEFAEKYPDDIRKLVDAGHEIGNHSDAHPHVKGMNINALIADTKEAARKIKMITGTDTMLYRAPYGEYDDTAVTTLEGMGYYFIQWSADSIDWQEPDAATIRKRILENTTSGSILLFHNDLANTTEALPQLLTDLKQKGFSFVPVSELIYTKDYHIDSTGKQIYEVRAQISEALTFSNNQMVNDALMILKSNLSFDEIASLKNGVGGISAELAARIAPMLTEEQMDAMSHLTEEEYTFAWNNLMASFENVSAGEAIDETSGSEFVDEAAAEPIKGAEEALEEILEEGILPNAGGISDISGISDYAGIDGIIGDVDIGQLVQEFGRK